MYPNPDAKCARHNHSTYYHGPCPACEQEKWIRKSEANTSAVIAIHSAIVGHDPRIDPAEAAQLAVEHARALQVVLGGR